jgi:hypothetical protein
LQKRFCHSKLPEDELTVVSPPIGDPDYAKNEYWLLNKTLYGLRRNPHHWFNTFAKALRDMGLQASVHDPCLFSGIVSPTSEGGQASSSASPVDPAAPLQQIPSSPPPSSLDPSDKVFVGIYMDDFVFYSENPEQEALFMSELKKQVVVDFMGNVDFFLGTAFTNVMTQAISPSTSLKQPSRNSRLIDLPSTNTTQHQQ